MFAVLHSVRHERSKQDIRPVGRIVGLEIAFRSAHHRQINDCEKTEPSKNDGTTLPGSPEPRDLLLTFLPVIAASAFARFELTSGNMGLPPGDQGGNRQKAEERPKDCFGAGHWGYLS